MEGGLQPDWGSFLGRVAYVSILVLMEGGLQPEKGRKEMRKFKGFNPCLNGRGTSTVYLSTPAGNDERFQSLS